MRKEKRTNKNKKQRIMERSKKKLSNAISVVVVKVRAWWKYYLEWRRARKIEKVNREMGRRSKEDIQIMEYRGKMYISYKGMPIVGEEDLGSHWAEVIGRSREVYRAWLSERELEK